MRHFRKSSAIIILLNLLGLGVLGFLGRQLYGDADQVIAAYQEFYTATRGKENLMILEKTLVATTDSRAAVAAAFLRSDELVLFIEKLEGLAKTAGVELNLAEPKPVVRKAASLELAFQATGSFAGLYRFSTLLENLPYRLEWQSLKWNLKGGTTWQGDFNLAVVSYTDDNATR